MMSENDKQGGLHVTCNDEIEITPEMIEAGDLVLCTQEPEWIETRKEFLERLFRAMWSARVAALEGLPSGPCLFELRSSQLPHGGDSGYYITHQSFACTSTSVTQKTQSRTEEGQKMTTQEFAELEAKTASANAIYPLRVDHDVLTESQQAAVEARYKLRYDAVMAMSILKKLEEAGVFLVSRTETGTFRVMELCDQENELHLTAEELLSLCNELQSMAGADSKTG